MLGIKKINKLANVAIVTGGAGGIGSVISKTLADTGTTVCISDFDNKKSKALEKEINSEGGKAIAVSSDVTSEKSINDAVNTVISHFGQVNALVYCAGNNVKAPILDITLEQWKSSLDTHLTGAFLFCQAVGKKMIEQRNGGKIILMSSVAATQPVPERGAYTPSKAGLIGLAKLLSLEWAQYNISTNAVCPGVTATPMTEMVYRRDPELKNQRLKRMPMGREIFPQEIADLVAFLCSNNSTSINGTAITIDGGFVNSGFLPES